MPRKELKKFHKHVFFYNTVIMGLKKFLEQSSTHCIVVTYFKKMDGSISAFSSGLQTINPPKKELLQLAAGKEVIALLSAEWWEQLSAGE